MDHLKTRKFFEIAHPVKSLTFENTTCRLTKSQNFAESSKLTSEIDQNGKLLNSNYSKSKSIDAALNNED